MARPAVEGLTPRQAETLDWIIDFIAEHSMPPTVREIGRAFGIKSSSVFDLLKALQEKGRLRRGKLGARSLIINEPGPLRMRNCAEVPVAGHIAAGEPILAFEDRAGTVTVDRDLLRGCDAYALRVRGRSMVEAGILDGDYVIIRRQDTAETGDIVVAIIEDEATLKRFYLEGGRVRLEPANRKMKPIYVEQGEFSIQGKVVAVHRVL